VTKKKFSIVIEDTTIEGKKSFHVYLEGDKDRLKDNIPDEDLTAAEYWASVLFGVCQSVLLEAGVIEKVGINPEDMN